MTIGPWLQIHFASWCSDFIIARVPKCKKSPLCIPGRSKKSGRVTRVYSVMCSLKTVGLEVRGKENQCNEVRRLDSRISVQVDLGEWWCVVKTLHRVMVYHGYVGRISPCTIFAVGWGRYTLSVDKSGIKPPCYWRTSFHGFKLQTSVSFCILVWLVESEVVLHIQDLKWQWWKYCWDCFGDRDTFKHGQNQVYVSYTKKKRNEKLKRNKYNCTTYTPEN